MDPNITNVRSDTKKIVQLLENLKKSKKLDYKIIDTSKITYSERMKAYIEVIGHSVFYKYEVRRLFGTNRKSGIWFGKEQPALFLEGDKWEVFPHRKKDEEVSIENFLAQFRDSKP